MTFGLIRLRYLLHCGVSMHAINAICYPWEVRR